MRLNKEPESNQERLKCLRCGRILKNPKSIKAGMGNVCRRKSERENQKGAEHDETMEIPARDSEKNDI